MFHLNTLSPRKHSTDANHRTWTRKDGGCLEGLRKMSQRRCSLASSGKADESFWLTKRCAGMPEGKEKALRSQASLDCGTLERNECGSLRWYWAWKHGRQDQGWLGFHVRSLGCHILGSWSLGPKRSKKILKQRHNEVYILQRWYWILTTWNVVKQARPLCVSKLGSIEMFVCIWETHRNKIWRKVCWFPCMCL